MTDITDLFGHELPDGHVDDDDDLGEIQGLPAEPPSGPIGDLRGERAEFCLCRLCRRGVSGIVTLDNDTPTYKVVIEHCKIGFTEAARNEVQFCGAYQPREFSLVAWLEGRAVRREARRLAEVENADALGHFPGSRSPVPQTPLSRWLRSLPCFGKGVAAKALPAHNGEQNHG